MIARLFDIQNDTVVPSEHCYTISWLKKIMVKYAENDEYLKVYTYLYYMTYPSPDTNPYFHYVVLDKEEAILEDLEAEFSTEDGDIQFALDRLRSMYETPTSRAYDGIAGMLDKLANFMKVTTITTGRDGNMSAIVTAAKNYDQIRNSFKGAYKDLQDEQQSRVRGGAGLAYDQE
jgi:hypothetical protein